MRKKAPEPEFLLTAARGRKTGDDCGPAGGFDIPCIQAAVGIPLRARAKCTQGMRAGEKQREKKTCTGEHRHLQRARTRGTEARADEKCTCGHAVRITEPRMRQAEKIRKSANDKFRRK